jgi:hypothetical protein
MHGEAGPNASASTGGGYCAAAVSESAAPADAGSGGAGAAEIDKRALQSRISELQDGAAAVATATASHEKVVAKEMKRLDKKLEDMAPDKALKYILAQHREALLKERESAAVAATAKSDLAKVRNNMA